MLPKDLRADIPHSARIYDYLLGGKDNFAPDRAAAEKILVHTPNLPISMRANRRFMARVGRYLAGRGLRQFLDVGTGLPTQPNLHEVVQQEAPEAAVVYVDNDPLVLAHARALLTSDGTGTVSYLDADLREPEQILDDPRVTDVLDLSKPVAVTLIAMLHNITEPGQAEDVTRRLMSRLSPGSALAVSIVTTDNDPEGGAGTVASYNSSGVPVVSRDFQQVSALLGGLDLVEPGIVPVHRWRPADEDRAVADRDVYLYGGVAIKP